VRRLDAHAVMAASSDYEQILSNETEQVSSFPVKLLKKLSTFAPCQLLSVLINSLKAGSISLNCVVINRRRV